MSIIEKGIQKELSELGELHFYRGIIYKNARKGEDNLQIRVLPHLKNTDEKDLPYYGCFFPDQLISGAAESSVGVDNATGVWIVSTPDFKTGWILGLAEDMTGMFSKKKKTNWDFQAFQDLCKNNIKLESSIFNPSELKVILNTRPIAHSYENAGTDGSGRSPKRDTATFLDVINVRTGDRIMIQQSGTCFAFLQDRIYLRVGSPHNKASYIDINPSKIMISANEIELEHRNKLTLGRHYGYLCSMLGAPTAIDGSPLIPLFDVSV